MKVFLGGYTSNESKGIYQSDFNKKDNKAEITNLENIVETKRPTYFQYEDGILFTIVEENGQGGIATYQKQDGKFVELDSYLHDGSTPCYIAVNTTLKHIYTANYHLATISVFEYNDQGQLKLLASEKHEGSGPRPEQDAAHPHFFDETPAGNLVSCDLGTDSVDFYKLEGNELKHLATYQMEKGFGTRHLTFSPDGKYMYIVGELSSQVNVARLDEDNWKFESIATYKTIPESFADHNGAAAIYLSNDGRYLYISNRGHDSLAVFKVLDDHKLELIQEISTFGSFPRDFNWTKDEKYLLAGNQNTSNATLYSRNSETGALTPIQKDIPAPEVTRVLFIEK